MDADLADWWGLRAELDCWREAGRIATFWWRDDDAIEPTPQLDMLLDIAGDTPVALAVVPCKVTEALALTVAGRGNVSVLQHGWRHESRNSDTSDEYPAGRDVREVANEIREGRMRLSALFGERSLPIFVPPYHRFHDSYLPLLSASGIEAISSKGDAFAEPAIAGLRRINGHVAPIEWTKPATFGPSSNYLGEIVEHLGRRRSGRCDPHEATGVLTHHLHQNAQSWDFMRRLSHLEHPAIAWVDAASLLRRRVEATNHDATRERADV
jgi:hypothetical protein